MSARRPSRLTRRRGFTLIELMVVVAIIAVLAAIGSYAYGRIVKRGRINEAITFFAAVGGAQTAYSLANGRYGATDAAAPFDAYDPADAAIAAKSAQWSAPNAAWAQIGIRLPVQTHFQYLMVAGDADTIACTPPPNVALEGGGTVAVPACDSITVGTSWYYIVGRADQDGDGFFSVFGTSEPLGQNHWSIEAIELE